MNNSQLNLLDEGVVAAYFAHELAGTQPLFAMNGVVGNKILFQRAELRYIMTIERIPDDCEVP
jgi:hypothetical protein